MRFDPALTTELSHSITAIVDLQALTVAVSYQHMAAALGEDDAWVSDRIRELAMTVKREAPKCLKPQFAEAYSTKLGHYAGQFSNSDEDGPRFSLIVGGKQDNEPPAV